MSSTAGAMEAISSLVPIRESTVLVREGNRHVGSGFVWLGAAGKPHGLPGIVITNKHVVEDIRAERLVCMFGANQRIAAKVLISDRQLDLAVLQMDVGEAVDAGVRLSSDVGDGNGIGIYARGLGEIPVRKIHAFTYAQPGDPVFALGSPAYSTDDNPENQYARRVVTGGIISGTHYSADVASELLLSDALQFSGMSGGPVVSALDWTVVGVVSRSGFGLTGGAGKNGEYGVKGRFGLNSMIPAFWIDYLWTEWQETGNSYPVRGSLGISERPRDNHPAGMVRAQLPLSITEQREEQRTGAAIRSTPEAGTPAADAGLRENDIIVEFNGVPIEDPGRLIGALDRHAVDRECGITIARGEELVDLWVTPRVFTFE